jgi:hypothetical protein
MLRVFDNRVMRIFGPKREEVVVGGGGLMRLHTEDLLNLNAPPDVNRLLKSRRIRRAEHVARMGEVRNTYNILVGISERKGHSEDLRVDGKIILEWI